MRSRPRYFAALVALAAMLSAQAAFALAVCDPVREMSRAQMIAAPEAENANCYEPTQDANLAACPLPGRRADARQASGKSAGRASALAAGGAAVTPRIATRAFRTACALSGGRSAAAHPLPLASHLIRCPTWAVGVVFRFRNRVENPDEPFVLRSFTSDRQRAAGRGAEHRRPAARRTARGGHAEPRSASGSARSPRRAQQGVSRRGAGGSDARSGGAQLSRPVAQLQDRRHDDEDDRSRAAPAVPR